MNEIDNALEAAFEPEEKCLISCALSCVLSSPALAVQLGFIEMVLFY